MPREFDSYLECVEDFPPSLRGYLWHLYALRLDYPNSNSLKRRWLEARRIIYLVFGIPVEDFEDAFKIASFGRTDFRKVGDNSYVS